MGAGFYLPADERPQIADEEIIAVYLVVNGSLEMSAGKIATQALQAGFALLSEARDDSKLDIALDRWQNQGWRTIIRVAETAGIFERVCAEVPGFVLRDEGLTEVEDGAATVFCSYPLRRGSQPKILAHKRVKLL